MTTEIWKDVVGWENFYEVSNFGNVRSKVRIGNTDFGERKYGGNQVKKINHNCGYDVVNLTIKGKRKQVLVHRLVLESFVGLPNDGFECCHNNGNRKDNRLENLRWDTRKNNHADKASHGTAQIGEKNGASKLTEKQARYIKKSNESSLTLSARYGVSKGCIEKVKYGYTWKHL
jgi:hypothetical protein